MNNDKRDSVRKACQAGDNLRDVYVETYSTYLEPMYDLIAQLLGHETPLFGDGRQVAEESKHQIIVFVVSETRIFYADFTVPAEDPRRAGVKPVNLQIIPRDALRSLNVGKIEGRSGNVYRAEFEAVYPSLSLRYPFAETGRDGDRELALMKILADDLNRS